MCVKVQGELGVPNPVWLVRLPCGKYVKTKVWIEGFIWSVWYSEAEYVNPTTDRLRDCAYNDFKSVNQ
jgi:hypothetical protein